MPFSRNFLSPRLLFTAKEQAHGGVVVMRTPLERVSVQASSAERHRPLEWPRLSFLAVTAAEAKAGNMDSMGASYSSRASRHILKRI
jgi:hypothetical protein